jgi:hypothetical protein
MGTKSVADSAVMRLIYEIICRLLGEIPVVGNDGLVMYAIIGRDSQK